MHAKCKYKGCSYDFVFKNWGKKDGEVIFKGVRQIHRNHVKSSHVRKILKDDYVHSERFQQNLDAQTEGRYQLRSCNKLSVRVLISLSD